MNKPKKILNFEITDEDGLGVFSIAQVLDPAIEVNFIHFEKEFDISDVSVFAKDDEMMRLAGPILIPNKEMYRKSYDAYIKFSVDSVERARTSFKKNNNLFANNIKHTESPAPSFLLEDWIVENPKTDKSFTQFGIECEKGTWFGVQQITDKDYWLNFIKTGQVKGFSVEIDNKSVKIKENFNMDNENKTDETPVTKLAIENMFETKDGKFLVFGDSATEISVGIKVSEVVDGVMVDIADGSYELVSGEVVMVKDGLVEDWKAVEEAPVAEVELAIDVAEVADAPVADMPEVEYATKEEVVAMLADVMSRLEKIELQLGEKDVKIEELSKELESTRSVIPGAKSLVLKSKQNLSKEQSTKPLSFSERLKKTYMEQGKF